MMIFEYPGDNPAYDRSRYNLNAIQKYLDQLGDLKIFLTPHGELSSITLNNHKLTLNIQNGIAGYLDSVSDGANERRFWRTFRINIKRNIQGVVEDVELEELLEF